MTGFVKTFLTKIKHEDPDYRYMAASDLLGEFKNDPSIKFDSSVQAKLVEGVLKLLSDNSSEVQGLALKCVPPLFRSLYQDTAGTFMNKLLEYALNLKSDRNQAPGSAIGLKSMRDVASLALKSTLSELKLDSDAARAIPMHMIPVLQDAIKDVNPDVRLQALEILHEVLVVLGPRLKKYHEGLSNTLMYRLDDNRLIIRKRVIACLADLSTCCDDRSFSRIVKDLAKRLEHAELSRKDEIGTYVQAASYISKVSGYRMRPHLSSFVPKLFTFCTLEEFAEDDELREHCLQTLSYFVHSCPREMKEYQKEFVDLVKMLVKYDPNYVGGEDDEADDEGNGGDAVMDDGEEEDEDDYSDDEEYSDDDDGSWKVRRGAVKCIYNVIKVQLLPLNDLYTSLGALLVSRFKEREESVKLDVFDAFKLLLSLSISPSGTETMTDDLDDTMAIDSNDTQNGAVTLVSTHAKQIIRALKRELNEKSSKTRIGVMSVLVDLISLGPHVMAPHISSFTTELKKCLADSSAQMKTGCLQFLSSAVEHCPPDSTDVVIERLTAGILAAADDRYYKITAESLKLCCLIMKRYGTEGKALSHIDEMFDACLERFKAKDQDSEIKAAALECVSVGVAYYGSKIDTKKVSNAVLLISNRLENEVTRLTSVRALQLIADSPQSVRLSAQLSSIVVCLKEFLGKNRRALRLETLQLLTTLTPGLAPTFDSDIFASLSSLIDVDDLRLSARALRLCTALLKSRGATVVPFVGEEGGIFAKCLYLIVSPLLQGTALADLQDLLVILAEVNCEPLTVFYMLKSLREAAASLRTDKGPPGSSQQFPVDAIAKCVAYVCSVSEDNVKADTASSFIKEMETKDPKQRVFAMTCLGELGRASQLSFSEEIRASSHRSILKAMDASEEEVQTAAAIAYGAITAGNNASEVPELANLIRQRPENRYLLLLALKEVIEHAAVDNVAIYVPLLLPLFLQNSFEEKDRIGTESVKTATAECLGLLAQVDPEKVIKALEDGAKSTDSSMKNLVLSSVRFAASSGRTVTHRAFRTSLKSSLGTFLTLLSDPDAQVRKSCLQAINGISRSRYELLQPHLDELLPTIYSQTVKNTGLVRTVDLGPFQYEEDDGLDIRKSAFEAMRTILAGPLASSVDMATFMEVLVRGLRDQRDVRSLAQIILTSIAASQFADGIIPCLDQIVKALNDTLKERVKENAVRQELDRHNDSIRSALRTVRTLEGVPQIAKHPSFEPFMIALRSGPLKDDYRKLYREKTTNTMHVGGMVR